MLVLPCHEFLNNSHHSITLIISIVNIFLSVICMINREQYFIEKFYFAIIFTSFYLLTHIINSYPVQLKLKFFYNINICVLKYASI